MQSHEMNAFPAYYRRVKTLVPIAVNLYAMYVRLSSSLCITSIVGNVMVLVKR